MQLMEVFLALRDHKDHKVFQDFPVRKEIKVTKGIREIKAIQGSQG